MTNHRVEVFVEAILADRPPERFSATLDDADLLRLAIELHASRSEKIRPHPQFVRDLGRQLAATAPGDARILSVRTGREAGGCERATLAAGVTASSGPAFPSTLRRHRYRGGGFGPRRRYFRRRQSGADLRR